MNLEDKVSKGIRMLRNKGHQVDGPIQFRRLWWEIDRRMLATPEEIEHIAEGVYSLSELEALYLTRQRDEADTSR